MVRGATWQHTAPCPCLFSGRLYQDGLNSAVESQVLAVPVTAVSAPGDRFWAKVEKGPGCWIWTASTFRNGRGQFGIGGRNRQAHLVAWELVRGAPPAGPLRNVCGEARCVRPEHHVIGAAVGRPRRLARSPEARFWEKVDRGPACWSWLGSLDRRGYGQFSVVDSQRPRRMVRAHRFAWELAHESVPATDDILHLCGNRACVRPDHLAVRSPDAQQRRPTPRQLEVLRRWAALGMRRGAPRQIASEMGIASRSVRQHLEDASRRVGATAPMDVVTWLDDLEPGWRSRN
jgi:DNA-binding CsgD family transcriptional regulator